MDPALLAFLLLIYAALRIISTTWGPWLTLFVFFLAVLGALTIHPICAILLWALYSPRLPDPPFHEEACPNCGSRPPIHCRVGPGDFSKCKAPRPGLF
ncbi:hypothetical protein [Neomegalonema perideroedes]|uniref:hypothetical protein n=1 Tax=Neomegalonema perideroedes TaxID=217219 RepID=UPI000376CC76|nr:hypothetical protein [Neomegalonema perideroedes]